MFLKISRNISCVREARSNVAPFCQGRANRRLQWCRHNVFSFCRDLRFHNKSNINSPKAPAKRGHIVAATLCPAMLPVRGETRHIFARRAGTRNVSEHFQKHLFLLSATNVARVKTSQPGNMKTSAMLPPQCVLAIAGPRGMRDAKQRSTYMLPNAVDLPVQRVATMEIDCKNGYVYITHTRIRIRILVRKLYTLTGIKSRKWKSRAR